MKNDYLRPEIQIIEFVCEDIVTASVQGTGSEFGSGNGDMNNGYVDNIFNP